MELMSDNLSRCAATSTAGGKGVMETLKQLFVLHSVDLRLMLLKSRVDVKLIQHLRRVVGLFGSEAVPTHFDHCHIKLVQPLLILLIISSLFTPCPRQLITEPRQDLSIPYPFTSLISFPNYANKATQPLSSPLTQHAPLS